jgi:hypothetical protein
MFLENRPLVCGILGTLFPPYAFINKNEMSPLAINVMFVCASTEKTQQMLNVADPPAMKLCD